MGEGGHLLQLLACPQHAAVLLLLREQNRLGPACTATKQAPGMGVLALAASIQQGQALQMKGALTLALPTHRCELDVPGDPLAVTKVVVHVGVVQAREQPALLVAPAAQDGRVPRLAPHVLRRMHSRLCLSAARLASAAFLPLLCTSLGRQAWKRISCLELSFIGMFRRGQHMPSGSPVACCY